jgi:uncharacterized protein (TIGR00725 family)
VALPLVAVVGPGAGAGAAECRLAESLGKLLALRNWALVTGGLALGVMGAASRGAALAGALTLGILPGRDHEGASAHLTLALPTGLGEARNALLVAVCDAIVVCGMSAGTASEAALALRMGKPTVFVAAEPSTRTFFAPLASSDQLRFVETPEAALEVLAEMLGR